MQDSAKQIAEYATFQAFINSYIKEVDNGHWMKREEWVQEQQLSIPFLGEDVIELDLPRQCIRLAVEVNYRSLTGRHVIGTVHKFCAVRQEWIPEDRLHMMISLIQELHLMAKSKGCHELASHFDELVLRLIESYQNMADYIDKRLADENCLPLEEWTFIETEQSLLFGHWLHPTPKSRQGMAAWQHPSYAPELKGRFQLHYFQLDRKIVKESSILPDRASDMIAQSLKTSVGELDIPSKDCLIPMHPLQAQWLLQQDYVRDAIEIGLIKDLGLLGACYYATSSIRTVYNPESGWMFKFSVPVKITNSLRVNRSHELKAGTAMAKLMKKIAFQKKHPEFRVVDDPAYITAELPGRKESGFEVIIRSNSFPGGKDKGVCSVAALVQDPLPGHSSRLYQLIARKAQSQSLPVKEVSFEWFKKYWKCSIELLITLYDEHGIALEAHQQNSVLDLSSGYPETYYFRDNQGFYLSRSHKKALCRLEAALCKTPELFYEDAVIQERFTYYLLQNQLFSVISRFGQDGLISEEELIQWAAAQLVLLEQELSGKGREFISHLLQAEKLSYKANLLTRFHDVDELTAKNEQAVYTYIPNPFTTIRQEDRNAKNISFVV
jgi:spermidine-citrate ligase